MYNVSLHTPAGNFRLPAGKASAHNHMELVKLFGFENGSYLDAYPQVDTIDTTGAIITYVERIDVLPFVATGQEFPHKWSKNQPTENSARYCPQN